MAEFMLPVRREEPRRGIRTSRGRVPEVSLHTAVKGQFGLGTGRAMGKALKKAMFLGKLHRKKRALSLHGLPATKKKPPPDMNYWRPPVHNVPGLERLWYESVHRSHAAVCGCGDFVRHITALAERYGHPGGPRAPGAPGIGGNPNSPPIRRARHPAAAPEPPAGNQPPALPWHGDGGNEGASGGGDDAGLVADFANDGLDELVAALDEEE
nr:ORF2 [Torque teno virus 10]